MGAYRKMRAGEPYAGPDPYTIELQAAARVKLDAFNAIPVGDVLQRRNLLEDMLGSFGQSFVVSPISWEYGTHVHVGDGVFINSECVFLDSADIRIGDGTVIAPRAMFLTAAHPVDPVERVTRDPVSGRRNGAIVVNKPITIGMDCWIGAGAIVLGGVTIGDGSTIGAGSVVTRSVPAGVVAAGNPCRVIRPATARRGE